MLEIPVYNEQGKTSGGVEIDPRVLGGRVRPDLLKQAIVMYQANLRQNTSTTRSRGMVVGSTRKLYRQKGAGNARAGQRRTVIRRGGGVAFAKGKQNFSQAMNKKMRRLARNNAILAKINSNDVVVLDELNLDHPNTKRLATLLRAVGAEKGCLLALSEPNDTVYKSGRNIPRTEVRVLGEVSAFDVLRRKKLVMTRPAFEALVSDPVRIRPPGDGSER